MKGSRIIVVLCSVFVCCFSLVFAGCKSEQPTDFDPTIATNLLSKLEVEDDNFISALTDKYEGTASSASLQAIISAIEGINSSMNTFIESYTDYKIMFASSEYKDVFSYNEQGFQYNEGSNLVRVSVAELNTLVVETGDDECYCGIEIVYIKDLNYAIRYFIQESEQEFGEEILCYFNGSSGRIAKRTCVLSQTSSIIGLEDYSNLAANTETGYYYFT